MPEARASSPTISRLYFSRLNPSSKGLGGWELVDVVLIWSAVSRSLGLGSYWMGPNYRDWTQKKWIPAVSNSQPTFVDAHIFACIVEFPPLNIKSPVNLTFFRCFTPYRRLPIQLSLKLFWDTCLQWCIACATHLSVGVCQNPDHWWRNCSNRVHGAERIAPNFFDMPRHV